MNEPQKGKFWRKNNPIMWGTFASVGVIGLLAITAWFPVCEANIFGVEQCSSSKWTYFWESSPNEVGDTLAGFAGALAFIWLIATVWLQSQELSEQRNELKEQRIATQGMADAMDKQVQLLSVQGSIFEDEQRQRKEQQDRLLLDERIESFSQLLLSDEISNSRWGFAASEHDWCYSTKGKTHTVQISPARKSGETFDDWAARHPKHIFDLPSVLNESRGTSAYHYFPPKPEILDKIVTKLLQIETQESSLSETHLERISRLNVRELINSFKMLQSNTEFWSREGVER